MKQNHCSTARFGWDAGKLSSDKTDTRAIGSGVVKRTQSVRGPQSLELRGPRLALVSPTTERGLRHMMPGLEPSRPVSQVSALSDRPTSVYLYYDRRGVLLYVGITARNLQRNDEHTAKEWWPFVNRQDVEHYPTRTDALRREKSLIQNRLPPFNKVHNPHHAEMRAAYLRLSTGDPKISPIIARLEDPMVLYKALNKHLPVQVDHFDHLSRMLVLNTRPEHKPLARLLSVGDVKQPVPVKALRKRLGWLTRVDAHGRQVRLYVAIERMLSTHLPDRGLAELQFKVDPLRVLPKKIILGEGAVEGRAA
jgi:predicted GIY-YIG superfamily endonuclease